MSAFDSKIAGCNPIFIAQFGDTFSYREGGGPTPPTGDNDRDVKVIKVQDAALYGQGSLMNVDELVIMVSSRNDTEGVVEINHRPPNCDRFVDGDGKVWFVNELIDDGNLSGAGMHTVRLKDKDVSY